MSPRVEIGDRNSALEEPDPLTAELRNQADTSGGGESWWTVAYPGGGPAQVAGFPRPLYPPGVPNKAASSDGPDVVAYKRTISRLGRWPWQAFDDSFSEAFSTGKGGDGMVGRSGVAGLQRQQGIEPDTGYVGKQTFTTLRYCLVPNAPGFTHAGEQAMDGPACNLINEAWQKFNAPDNSEDEVRDAIADFCAQSIDACPVWHYEQYRPMRYLGTNPSATHYSDCSEHATEAYYWARLETGVAVPDPNHSGYNGYGYTGTLISNPHCWAPYKPGDLAIYGSSESTTEHVAICFQAGDDWTAVWCSHGSEEAPYPVELNYRNDLLAVVRPALTP